MKSWMTSLGSCAGSGVSVLCCVGKPALIGILSVMGVGVSIRDGMFLPFLIFFLGLNLYVNYRSIQRHGRKEVFLVALVSAPLVLVGLWVSGVVVMFGILGMFFAFGLDLYFSKAGGVISQPLVSMVQEKGGGKDGNNA